MSDLDDALARFAARDRVLVALDFDGVLAPIVADRDAARPLPENADAVRRLVAADGVSLALVSGRAMADLRRLADPPHDALLVASHGAEVRGAEPQVDDAARQRLADVLDDLAAIVAANPGTDLERKPAGGVLHTRNAPRDLASAASRAALDGPARRDGVHVLEGKEVVELSVVDTDKGRAVAALREQVRADAVLYAGDDVTDERAFAVLGPDDVGIKVGDGETLAAYRVSDPAAVAATLHRLVELRSAR